MAKVARPIALGLGASPASDASPPANRRRHRAARFRIAGPVIAAIAVFGVLLMFAETHGRVHESVDAPVSVSTATPAISVSNAETRPRDRPAEYFPDQFRVEHWDESPLPPQF